MKHTHNWGLFPPVLASAAFVLELTLTPATLPAIRGALELELSELALYVNSYSFAVALGVVFSGVLGHKCGETGVFLVGTLLFSIGCFLVLMSEQIHSLLMARSVKGLGAGLFIPIVPVLLTKATSEKPGRILIVCGAISGYLAGLAPITYGSLLKEGNWITPYISLAVISLLAFALSITSNKRCDKTCVKQSNAPRFSIVEAKGLMGIYVYIFCTYGAVTYYLFKSPILVSDSGFNITELGGLLTLLWVSFSTVSLALRNLVDSYFISFVLATAPVALIAGLVLLSLPYSPPILIASAFLVGVGLACSNSPSTQVILTLTPRRFHSLASSLDFIFARLGGVLCSTLCVVLLPQAQVIVLLYLLAAAIAAASFVRPILHQRMLASVNAPRNKLP
ncbi:MFS transporter [Gymnodinialimonas sp. 2305UL16-5]|uniref:MFS transporter n=1 Tax=Gymnodinialimonas mytili TaxID=3126503 RepID=UPI0030B1D3C9